MTTQQIVPLSPTDINQLQQFLIASLAEMIDGIQEISAEMIETQNSELTQTYINVLAGVAGAATSAALLYGVEAETFGLLSKTLNEKVFEEFDKIRSQNIDA